MTHDSQRHPAFRRRLLVLITFLGTVGLLSLADRAPRIARHWLRRSRDLGSRVEQRLGVDWVDRSDVPLAWDAAGHVVLWAVAAVLARLAVGHRWRTRTIAAALFALSGAAELAQAVFASTRSPEWSDLAANGAGIAIGVLLAAAGLRFVPSRWPSSV